MTKGKPVCLINVYLTTNGHKTSSADYIKELEKLASIIEMHRSDRDILIIGDFKASITRTTPNTNDKLLRSFVAENALVADEIEAPSFRHHDGKKSSKIDYLMTIIVLCYSVVIQAFTRQLHKTYVLERMVYFRLSRDP